MENFQPDLLDSNLQSIRRRTLLPLWIKIFIWIFLVLGVVIPIALIFGLTGQSFQLAIYGLETNNPFSIIGTIVLLIFSLKTIVAAALWTEKNWAIKLAITDALIGILICLYIMLIAPFLAEGKGIIFTLRLELIALIPYLIKLIKIKQPWNEY